MEQVAFMTNTNTKKYTNGMTNDNNTKHITTTTTTKANTPTTTNTGNMNHAKVPFSPEEPPFPPLPTSTTTQPPRRLSDPLPNNPHSHSHSNHPHSNHTPTKTQTHSQSREYVHPKIPPQLNQYQFLKTLGQGSIGKVKLALDLESGGYVAIKCIPRYPDHLLNLSTTSGSVGGSGGSSGNGGNGGNGGGKRRRKSISCEDGSVSELEYDPQRTLRIIRESTLLTLLNHPNIVQFKHFLITNDWFYLVMEYVENGIPLLDYVMQYGRMSEFTARGVMKQICEGVEYCHQRGVVHRDLKIENILIVTGPTKSGSTNSGNGGSSGIPTVKIIDFGLSNINSPTSLLQTYCGSLYFAAPELLNAQPYLGSKVDIWSLGVILYVLCCGSVPFDDCNLLVLHKKIKSGVFSVPGFVSEALRGLLRGMICVDVTKRWSLSEVLESDWMRGCSTSSSNTGGSGGSTTKGYMFEKFKIKYGNTIYGNKTEYGSTNSSTGSGSNKVPMALLQGRHPNPLIIAALKRSPFDVLPAPSVTTTTYCSPYNHSHSHFSTPSHTQSAQCKIVSSPLDYGYATGFGYTKHEVDEVIQRAMQSTTTTSGDDDVYGHSVIGMYYLLHEYLQRSQKGEYGSDEGDSGEGDIFDEVPEYRSEYGSEYGKEYRSEYRKEFRGWE